MAIRRQSESSGTALSSEQLTRLRQLAAVLREVPSVSGRQLEEEDAPPELLEAFETLRAAGVPHVISGTHISRTRTASGHGYFIAGDAPQLTAAFIDKLVDDAFGAFLDRTLSPAGDE